MCLKIDRLLTRFLSTRALNDTIDNRSSTPVITTILPNNDHECGILYPRISSWRRGISGGDNDLCVL